MSEPAGGDEKPPPPLTEAAEKAWLKLLDHIEASHGTAIGIFRRMDRAGDGHVSMFEFQTGLAALGLQDTDEMAEIVAVADHDGDGYISLSEFHATLRTATKIRSARGGGRRDSKQPSSVSSGAHRHSTSPQVTPQPAEKRGYPRTPPSQPSARPSRRVQRQASVFDLTSVLKSLVGQEKIKSQLQAFRKALVLDKRRRSLGNLMISFPPPHMMFLGNPGTGKTKIARIISTVMKDLGMLAKGHLIEVQRADLVAGYVGQTAEKTRKKIEEAKGGVLFVDEAYRLSPPNVDKDFGREALDEIMGVMNDGDPVMIFAGYEKEMRLFMESNAGLYRRINKQFHFADYEPSEIALILIKAVEDAGFTVTSQCSVAALGALVEGGAPPEMRARMNGGIAKQLLDFAKEELDARLSEDATEEELCLFSFADFEGAMGTISEQWREFMRAC